MYKTGDLPKNIEKLKIELKQIKYLEKLDIDALYEGNPLVFLPILHFTLLSYSKYVAQYLLDNDYELYSKSDKEFVEKIFKCMINLFNYKPTLNSRQFFMSGYAEAKVIFCLEVIRIVKQEHNNLLKKTYSVNNVNNKNKNSKVNDSFRSVKSKEPIRDENLNNKKIKVINHMKEENFAYSPKLPNISSNKNEKMQLNKNTTNNNSYISHSDDLMSPKFNDDDQINYNRKYNFNTELIKDTQKNKNDKKENTEPRQASVIKYNLEEEYLDSEDGPKYDDGNIEVNYERSFENGEQNENYEDSMNDLNENENKFNNKSSNLINPPKNNKNSLPNNNQANVQNNFNLTSVVEIINTLANSVKEMTSRVDSFKTSIESRVSKLEAEISLIKNRLSMIDSNLNSNGNIKIKQNNQTLLEDPHLHDELSNTQENNEHIFSFADDHNSNMNNKLAQKLDDMNNVKGRTEKYDNKYKSQSHKNNSSGSVNNYMNKIPTKILNDIEDTDSLIQRVANRFKETQKLLNEFK